MKESSFEKNLNKEIEAAAGAIFKFLGRGIKRFFLGFTKLNNIYCLIGLVATIAISISIYIFKASLFRLVFMLEIKMPLYLQYALWGFLVCVPVFYLIFLGGLKDKKQEEYKRIFGEIGFRGKDGKTPYYLGSREEDKRKIYIFKSNISLLEWRAARDKLETGLNCNILKIENGSNKKVVELTTISGDYKIPAMLYWKDEYISPDNGVVRIGQSALHEIEFNLNRTPHVLIAGETGSGKSVILRTCLWQMIKQGCRVYMIDFKGGVEFGKCYEEYGEVVMERKRALEVLTKLCKENEKRLKLFRSLEVKNLPEYNKRTGQNLCRICVFCDEIAEMLDKKGVAKEDKEIMEQLEGKLSTLARLSRATGINLFLGVQRPDANVLTGQIKNNVPVRISGRFADKTASEIVLGNSDAVKLPDIKGRFLFKLGNDTEEFQSYYFDDDSMLREIDVEPGDMLMEGTRSEPGKVQRQVIYKQPEEQSTDEASFEPEISLDFDFENMWSVEKNEEI